MHLVIEVIERGTGEVKQVLNRTFCSRDKMREVLFNELKLEPWDYVTYKSKGYNKKGELVFNF